MIKYILNEKYFMRCSYVSQLTMAKFMKIVKKSGPPPIIKAVPRNDIMTNFYFTI